MSKEWKIEGKNVLITGGASGLGAAYVEAFLDFGAEKVAILDVTEKGKAYIDKLNETYLNKVIFIKCDVSKEENIEKSFKEVLDVFKSIDVIINNAGVMNDSTDVWRTASDVNWQGVVSFTRKGIEHMRKDENGVGGTIINVSSQLALFRMEYLPVYSGSKAAVLHFGRCLSSPVFYDSTGVRILTILFGPTSTALLTNLEQKFIEPKSFKHYLDNSDKRRFQNVQSAVDALLKMFRDGEPGSVWLSANDQPGQDITSFLDEAFKPLEKLGLP